MTGEAAATDGLRRSAQAQPAQRVVRLDRLIDLFDAARFAEDEYAREALWEGLGGHEVGIGDEATRAAAQALLTDALAIEAEGMQGLAPPMRDFVADAIMLLSTDIERPQTAEDLGIQTLAYRTLAEQGHPRVADNARWRLYDHVRGALQGAAEAPASHRMDVAVHALYARDDDITTALTAVEDGTGPGVTADSLWALGVRHRDALAGIPRWRSVVKVRARIDGALLDTVQSALPARRDPKWQMPTVAAGMGRSDSGAPALVADAGRLVVDAGRPHHRTVGLGAADVDTAAAAVSAAVALDGRGTAFVAVNPMLPAPELRTVLRALRRAQVARIELGVREAKGPDARVAVLPLEVGRTEDPSAGARAMNGARIHLHLGGRGLVAAIDGRTLTHSPGTDAQLQRLIERLRRAYPREKIVRVTIGADVVVTQLRTVLGGLVGGGQPRFAAAGWLADGGPPTATPTAAADEALKRRVALGWDSVAVELDQAFPLRPGDQKRLEAFAETLGRCVPELEAAKVPSQVRIDLKFSEGRLLQATVAPIKGSTKAGRAALAQCVEQEAFGLRLREHRDAVAVGVTLRPRPRVRPSRVTWLGSGTAPRPGSRG